MNALVERYFSVFLDEVAERQGDVNETMGDGFMAVFQSTDPILHSVRAAETALVLLSATRQLNEVSQQTPIEVHIGVASGLALLGSTQFEGRHGTRWVFSASGREVILAARLASTARAGQILVSPETRCRLGGHYVTLSEGSQKLKNIEEEIEIFQLVRRS